MTNFAASLYPEIRAFGTVGLYFMKLGGQRLSVLEENLIELNQCSDIMIGGVQNAIEFIRNYIIDEKMSDVLKNDRLEHSYKYFKTF